MTHYFYTPTNSPFLHQITAGVSSYGGTKHSPEPGAE